MEKEKGGKGMRRFGLMAAMEHRQSGSV